MKNLFWFGQKKWTFILLVSILSSLISCANNVQNEDESFPYKITEFEKLPQDFKEYHLRFHTDSIFQFNNIEFPLRGLPAHFTEEDQYFEWELDSWIMHKTFDESDKAYRREWIVSDNNSIDEYIYNNSSDFGMQRTFQKRANIWYLKYYVAMNRIQ